MIETLVKSALVLFPLLLLFVVSLDFRGFSLIGDDAKKLLVIFLGTASTLVALVSSFMTLTSGYFGLIGL